MYDAKDLPPNLGWYRNPFGKVYHLVVKQEGNRYKAYCGQRLSRPSAIPIWTQPNGHKSPVCLNCQRAIWRITHIKFPTPTRVGPQPKER